MVHLRGHLLYFQGRSEPTIVDLGAHLGEFSRQALQAFGGDAIAVEANPELAARIKPQADLRVLSMAVAANTGTTTLAVGRNPEASSTVCSPTDLLSKVSVPAIGIRQLLADEAGGRASILKLDVEGAEIEVIGALSDEEISALTQVTVEFHDEHGYALPEDVARVCARMKRLGYAEFRSSRSHPTTDVLFVNRRRAGLHRAEELWLRLVVLPAMGLVRVLRRIASGGRWTTPAPPS